MSTNNLDVTDDGEMPECEGEKVVTMMDVLQEQQDFEDDANAVLGASDEKNCTYSKGYIKRQAIYACLTCCSDARIDLKQRAGVCLACSLNCHENHELVELYTKRNFRCDCGNPKFNHPCQFVTDKKELNSENLYNQNFSGLYCICSRPYPDPDATFEDEMIQCIICEDWLHASHLEATVPNNEQYSEMICKLCMEKNDFLHDYSELVVNVEDREIEVTNDTTAPLTNGHDSEKLDNGDADSIKDILTDIEMQIEGEKKQNSDISVNENSSSIETSKDTDCNKRDSGDDKIEENDNIGSANTENNISAKNESNMIDTVESNTISKENSTEESAVPMDTEQIESERQESNSHVEHANAEDNSEPRQEMEEHKDIATDITQNNEDNLENTSTGVCVKEPPKLLDPESIISKDEAKESDVISEIPSITNTDKLESENKDKSRKVDAENNPENTNLDKNDTDKQEPISTEENNDSKDVPMESDTNNENDGDTLERATEELSKLASDDNESDENLKVDRPDENVNSKDNKDDVNLKNSSNDNTEISKTNTTDVCAEIKTTDDSIEMTESKTMDDNIEMPESKTTDDSTNQITSSINNTFTPELQEANEQLDIKRKLEDTPELPAKKPKLHDCTRPKSKKVYKGATFWPAHFRQKLCTCSECLTMYRDLSVMFLIDPEDTVTAYEALGKERVDGSSASQYEKGLEALSSLDRVQQINALTEYNKMRDKLLDFLKSFKDKKEVVKEEDIRAFFADMKPRREPDGVYFCR